MTDNNPESAIGVVFLALVTDLGFCLCPFVLAATVHRSMGAASNYLVMAQVYLDEHRRLTQGDL